MSEMEDRVVKAIETALIKSDAEISHFKPEQLVAAARAAIAAMREPTDEMVHVVDVSGETDAGGFNATYYIGAPEAKKVWQAMIDEALK